MPDEQLYFIGDPCYVVDDWVSFCAQYLDAIETGDTIGFDFMGHRCFVTYTQHGDGCFNSKSETEYPVDHGTIGVVPLVSGIVKPEFCRDSEEGPYALRLLGRIVKVDPTMLDIDWNNGTIFIKPIDEEIYTSTFLYAVKWWGNGEDGVEEEEVSVPAHLEDDELKGWLMETYNRVPSDWDRI